jgi:hypothetical protein
MMIDDVPRPRLFKFAHFSRQLLYRLILVKIDRFVFRTAATSMKRWNVRQSRTEPKWYVWSILISPQVHFRCTLKEKHIPRWTKHPAWNPAGARLQTGLFTIPVRKLTD